MRKITLLSMISLDGVMQSPGGKEEDPENGFDFGGWTAPFSDEIYEKVVGEETKEKTDFLLGRKTFEIWENYWPFHGDFWPQINDGTKYVLSNTRTETNWKNTEFITSVEEIKKLKNSKGSDIQVWGSSELAHLLMKHDLIDEIRLKIHPIIFGKGKNIFDPHAVPANFEMLKSEISPKGVIFAHYKRNGKIETKDVEL